ncbi:MAG: hypothetical protein DVB25_00200 [Verrucomicrobia bacterium]|nr:MAG: hypothetical protein DVB25_00200 [Verrucomicrobiota bacterium]
MSAIPLQSTTPRAFATDTTSLGAAPPAPDLLLVCLQDPFEGIGDSSSIVRATVPAADGNLTHQWMLETALEINPPRFFASWATRASFILDLSVSATTMPSTGTWAGTVATLSGSGNCRVMVMRNGDDEPQFSLVSDACHAPEVAMPAPAQHQFLNADIAFELNGKNGLSAGAVAVISSLSWSHLIAGSSTATHGLAFDSKWRHNIAAGDGDAQVVASWAFAVMSPQTYQELCDSHGWVACVI